MYWGEPWTPFKLKYLLAIAITLLPSVALAEQFTPEQLIEVMTKSPENRDVRVHDFPVLVVSPDYVPSQPNGEVFD